MARRLLIRNLPYTTTVEEFKSLFENDGPLTKYFVVEDPGDPQKCKGFGYVTFDLEEDAEKVLKSQRELGGRRLLISLGGKKLVKRKSEPSSNEQLGDAGPTGEINVGKGDQNSSDLQNDPPVKKVKFDTDAVENEENEEKGDEATTNTNNKSSLDVNDAEQPLAPKKQETGPSDEVKTVFVKNIPFRSSDEKVSAFFAKFGPLESCKLFDNRHSRRSRGGGFITFTTRETALECVKAANDTDNPLMLDGRQVSVELARSKEKKNLFVK